MWERIKVIGVGALIGGAVFEPCQLFVPSGDPLMHIAVALMGMGFGGAIASYLHAKGKVS